MVTQAELEYYAAPGRMTDLSSIAEHVRGLPADVASIARLVQLVIVHRWWDERYGVTDAADRDDEMQIRPPPTSCRRRWRSIRVRWTKDGRRNNGSSATAATSRR